MLVSSLLLDIAERLGDTIVSRIDKVKKEEGAPPSVCEGGSWGCLMTKRLKRYYGQGHLHFITFSCRQRLPLLATERVRSLFVSELARVREEYGFLLLGYVVMPNHVHLLMSEPKKGTPSTVLQMLKQRVSRKLRQDRATTSDEEKGKTRPFWQSRFYDFNVYREGKIKEKLNYMHANPVTRGLVKHPKDWPWSSWSFYFRGVAELVTMDGLNELQTSKEKNENPKTHP